MDERPSRTEDDAAQPRSWRYANDLRVDISLSECRLDFAQNFGTDDVSLQCRLITSPTGLVRFLQAINDAVSSYEGRYGTIPRSDRGGED